MIKPFIFNLFGNNKIKNRFHEPLTLQKQKRNRFD